MIIVAGKPRAGTTSVAKALDILGLNSLHFCPVTTDGQNILGDFLNGETNSSDLWDYQAIVSWKLTSKIHILDFLIPIEKVILLDRMNGWEASCEQFNIRGQEIKKIQSDFDYAYEWSKDSNRPVLKINLEQIGWGPICSFLNVDIPNIKFPKINTSEDNFSI